MSQQAAENRLPVPAATAVYSHIARLQRELRLARRLLKLALAAEDERGGIGYHQPRRSGKAVPCGR